MSLKFGTSGLRGLSVDLDGPAAAIYSTAFARYLFASGQAQPGDRIMIGRDFRASSPSIAAICAGALSRAGFRVVDCGMVPTPALALYAGAQKAAALMVTGSHIPADRNGIKFYRPDGEIAKPDEEAIGAEASKLIVEGEPIDATPAEAEDGMAPASEQFLTRNKAILPEKALAGLRIGVYQHSTVARDLFMDVLSHYGAEVIALGRSTDFIPVDTEAVSAATIESLKGWASEHRLDGIVSADGDGDRPLVADEAGMPLRGDFIGLVAAQFVGATIAVTPVTSNSGLERHIPVLRTRVGSPYVIEGMTCAIANGEKGVVGFEANGGTLTATPFTINGTTLTPLPTRDSFLPALAVFSFAKSKGITLSALAASYALPVAVADRIENFSSETSAALMAYLRASRENLAAFLSSIDRPETVSDIDGLRVTLADGRVIHFRPSGNAPEMRCYVEAETEAAALALLEEGLKRISGFSEGHA
ncbi:phosphomannomutase [Pararhizobium capsulatum DSM 1112]|uniref:Phosphomannomutase n=1 Tax=Pararhizobium capsulatum DSM 1112 TaxID=1121113 RepID=A0ABU0BLA5_9HYPH|nr:phosphomannomutase [Pararhizobium capsulatum]MDQ0318519.1 phosphomannomutase [Pararhizobium capsulatum DSM 1112]